MKRSVFIVFLLVVAGSANGQSILAFAPWEFGAEVASASESDWTEVAISARRAVPVGSLLPQITADSFLHTMGLQIGTRYLGGDYDTVRYRATALDLAMQRTYGSGSFTVLDHNQTGLMDRKTTWIGAGYGPGIHLENPTAHAWLRITAGGQWITMKAGSFLFPESFKAKSTTSGLAYQLGARAGVKIGQALLLNAIFEWDEMTKADFVRKQWSLNASYPVSSRFSAKLGYISARFELDGVTRSVNGISGSLRLSLASAGF